MSRCHFGTIKINTNSRTITDILNDLLMIDIIVCLYIELIKCYSGIAAYLNFIPDINNVMAILLLFKSGKISVHKKISSISAIFFMAWIIISFPRSSFEILVGYKRFRYILFGLLAYYICVHYMTKYYWNRILKILFITQIIHTILVVIQFAFIRTVPDMTNGVFGHLEYNNSAQGVFCLVMSMIGMEYYLKSTIAAKHSIAMIVMSCFTCALAEIKAFYVLFVLGSALTLLFNKKDERTIKRCFKLMAIAAIGIVMALLLLLKIMPENLYAFTGIKNWAEYESYGNRLSGINMGRLNQMSFVFENIFECSYLKALVGKGVGASGDFAVYEMSHLFFNFGLIGLGTFLAFIAANAAELYAYRKKVPEAMISMNMFVLTVPIMIMWNAPLNRMALLVFVILGIGAKGCFYMDRGIQEMKPI